MKKHTFQILAAALTLALLLTVLTGCGGKPGTAETAEPVSPAAPVSTEEPAAAPAEIETETGRQDGERFEDVIMLEGMEETVRYEHVRNDAVGVELDYDYELLERRSDASREYFVSLYDLPDNPENYLEITFSAADAETAAASVSEQLSVDYNIIRESFTLARAGSCICIDASNAKGNGGTPDQLQTVYIIPASDGCRIAAAHCSFEAAEGFGARFRRMMDTLTVIPGTAESRPSVTGVWQTASMAYEADGSMYPEYYVWFTDTDIVYGHMKDGEFVFDHSDKISLLQETAAGRFKVQATGSNGVQYTYQTSEGDDSVLEYYETWREEDFPAMYRGGASLSRLS